MTTDSLSVAIAGTFLRAKADPADCIWVTIHGHPVCIRGTRHVKPVKDEHGRLTHTEFSAMQSKFIDSRLSAIAAGELNAADIETSIAALDAKLAGLRNEADQAKPEALSKLMARIVPAQDEREALAHVLALVNRSYDQTTGDGPQTLAEKLAIAGVVSGLGKQAIRAALTGNASPQYNENARLRARIESAILTAGLAEPDALQTLMTVPYYESDAILAHIAGLASGPEAARAYIEYGQTPLYDLQQLGGIVVSNLPVYGRANCRMNTRVLTMGATSLTGDFRHELGHAIHATFGGHGLARSQSSMARLIEQHHTAVLARVAANPTGRQMKMSHEWYESEYGVVSARALDSIGEDFAEVFRVYNKYALQTRTGSVPDALDGFKQRFPLMTRWFNAHYTAALWGRLARNNEW